ncbi:hypothetical protein Tco_1553503 [Tanacetum coccineum]
MLSVNRSSHRGLMVEYTWCASVEESLWSSLCCWYGDDGDLRMKNIMMKMDTGWWDGDVVHGGCSAWVVGGRYTARGGRILLDRIDGDEEPFCDSAEKSAGKLFRRRRRSGLRGRLQPEIKR